MAGKGKLKGSAFNCPDGIDLWELHGLKSGDVSVQHINSQDMSPGTTTFTYLVCDCGVHRKPLSHFDFLISGDCEERESPLVMTLAESSCTVVDTEDDSAPGALAQLTLGDLKCAAGATKDALLKCKAPDNIDIAESTCLEVKWTVSSTTGKTPINIGAAIGVAKTDDARCSD